MNYLLDTDTVADLYDLFVPEHASISRRVAQLADDDELCISILTHCELEYSYDNSPDSMKQKLRKQIDHILRSFSILPLDGQVARYFAELKSGLKNLRLIDRANIRRHNIDFLIAATALDQSCVLVSHDAVYQDLAQINSALRVEVW
ncbi:MAG: type II toxin-antitoxin system VapC family toxin [Candidatus Schekmanbacteria bacterium]|nr:type II toxin-antitoxin system VapC family toxin [Candidatus Schekmanbacteria bacterium]